MASQPETTMKPYITPVTHLYAIELSTFIAISFANDPDITTNDRLPSDYDANNQFAGGYRTHLWED